MLIFAAGWRPASSALGAFLSLVRKRTPGPFEETLPRDLPALPHLTLAVKHGNAKILNGRGMHAGTAQSVGVLITRAPAVDASSGTEI